MLSLSPLGGSVTTLSERWRDAEREGAGRLRGDPEAEVLVHLVELLEDLLQGLEPAGHEVAVLQDDPEPALDANVEQRRGDGALALAEGDALKLVPAEAHLVREDRNVRGRVRARAEDEHDGGHGRALGVDLLIVDDGRLDVLLGPSWRRQSP